MIWEFVSNVGVIQMDKTSVNGFLSQCEAYALFLVGDAGISVTRKELVHVGED